MEEVRFSDGDIEVTVLPGIGARIHRITAFGVDLLRTPDDPVRHLDDPFFWGAYVMAPWCNRIAVGTTSVASTGVPSRRIDLASNFPDGTAIHGQVYARSWDHEGDGFRVVGGGDGWPWPYEATLRVAVAEHVIQIDQVLRNLADDPMPAGIGIHPWFRRPLHVAIHADTVFPSNIDSPADPIPVTGSYDLRRIGPMASDLDATWSAVEDPPVELAWPEHAIRSTMTVQGPATYIVAASPTAIDAVAIEPQTHAPDGLRRMLGGEPGGLTPLAPGMSLRQLVRLAIERV